MTARSIAQKLRVPAPNLPPLPRVPANLVRVLFPLAVLALAWRLGQQPVATAAAMVFLPVLILLLFRARPLIIPAAFAMVTLIPITFGGRGDSAINLAIVAAAGLFAFEFARRLASRKAFLPPSEGNAPWVALSVVALLSILAGGTLWDPRVAVDADFMWVQLAQLAVIALSACAFWLPGLWLGSRRELGMLVGLVIAVAVGHVMVAAIPNLPIPGMTEVWANPAARVWLVAMPGALALFREDLRPLPRLALLALAVAMVVVPWRADEGWASGWLPGLVTFISLLGLRLGRVSLFLGLAALAPSSAFFLAYLLPRLAANDHWSLATRVQAWQGMIDLLDGRWALGLGLASYWHYWRGIIGSFSYFDPSQGYMHFTLDPKVNMHNNYMDILGQMGLLGIVVFAWLAIALFWHAARVFRSEHDGFGYAYAAAAICGLTGMLASGMLGDWFFPFVYNIGLGGFRGSSLGWLLLGGLCVLDATRIPKPITPE